MLDLNRLLLFVAVLSPVVVLVRTARRAALNRGWQLAAATVLLVTGVAWMVAPAYAGCVGGGAWFALLFLPAVGLRKAMELAAEERYRPARRIMRALRWVHPAQVLRDEVTFLCAMETAQNNEPEQALRLLDSLRSAKSGVAAHAIAQSLRIRRDWPALLGWCRQNLPLVALGQEPGLLPLYLRALGETRAVEELIIQAAGRAPGLLASAQHQITFDWTVLLTLAFTGRTDSLHRLLETGMRRLDAEAKEFWIGTSELAGGATEAGRARLETLQTTTTNALLRAEIAERLNPEQPLSVTLSPASEATVRRFENNLSSRRRSLLLPQSGQVTRAVAVLIALNVVMFILEMAGGGSTNYYTLRRLGALEPFAVLARGEYWRLLSALFLHHGALHLAVNLYALYLLGPTLERALGTTRFAICYLAAGLGSSAGVVAAWRFGWIEANLLVGASGAVMGIIGAWAGLLLRHHHLPMARRRLIVIGVIVLLQSAFDYYTPQISMAAHLCGLLSGLIIGLILAPPPEADSGIWPGQPS